MRELSAGSLLEVDTQWVRHRISPFSSRSTLLRVDFQGSRVTSDGGLILIRELDERLRCGELIEQYLTESRAKNARFPFADLLRQSVYSRLAGYEDLNDAERLSQDPTFRLIGSEKVWDRGAALTSPLQTFEAEMLADEENFAGLAGLSRALLGRAEAMDSGCRTVLDMDSTEITVYGEQEQSAYNGHFESTCYHPLLLFNREGDCLAAKLRSGNVHSAEDWEELLLPEIERQQRMGKEVAFRADAAFAKPEIYAALEKRDVKYAIRIPANDSLERDIAELLPRPVGRPSQKPVIEYKGFLYQAGSWNTARRVVAKSRPQYREALQLVKETEGTRSPWYAIVISNIGLLCFHRADFDRAGRLLREALDLLRDGYGDDDPVVAQAACNLAARLWSRPVFRRQLHRSALRFYNGFR